LDANGSSACLRYLSIFCAPSWKSMLVGFMLTDMDLMSKTSFFQSGDAGISVIPRMSKDVAKSFLLLV
jgi:hypothetical protein